MKLKTFFELLAGNEQKVEIYYNQENRDAVFGFRINDIDSVVLAEDSFALLYLIDVEINNAFLDSGLIDEGEGDTSYFLQPDSSCIKSAKYFDWVTETEQFWIENNVTEFDFENSILPFEHIFISKDLNTFKIDKERTLRNIISKELYEKFASFYKELLNGFQEMEIELQLENCDKTGTTCSILSMYGSYKENMEFTLLDSSKVDIPKDELNLMLTKYFRIDALMASQILKEKEE